MYGSGSVFAGPSHEVGLNQLFFSTTDSGGSITRANSVFCELVRRPLGELIGVPHNVNRHPGMPGAAFHLMWTTLKDGRPFCAYVHNMASDGSRYTVFATIVPQGAGYLSVRSPVCVPDLLAAATSLYEAVRPQEWAARAEGASAHEAAVGGLEALVPLLQSAGFPSYDDFIRVALPAEVLARDAAGAAFPERPDASGPMADLLGEAGLVHARLLGWLDLLGRLQTSADALASARDSLGQTVQAWLRKGDEFAEVSAGAGFQPVLLTINVWREMTGELGEMLTDLVGDLDDLAASCAETRFRIALARLQNDALGQFAAELVDGAPEAFQARPAILDLVGALETGIASAARQLNLHSQLAAMVASAAGEMAQLVTMVTDLLASWRRQAAAGSSPMIAELLPSVAALVERGQADADLLDGLAREAEQVLAFPGLAEVRASLSLIRTLAVGNGTSPTLSGGVSGPRP